MNCSVRHGPLASLGALLASSLLAACVYNLDRPWTDSGGSMSDVGLHDTSIDGPPAPPPDGELPPDTRTDSVAPPPDTRAPDTTVDSGPPAAPCSQGQPSKTFGPTMAVCALSTPSPQCAADKACNSAGGWKLCTASQFLARGGKDQSVVDAWIGACIRSGGAPHPATDGPCSSCLAKGTDEVTFAWPCSPLSGAFHGTPDYLAVKTSNQCFRLGSNDPAYEAHWEWEVVQNPLSLAVCCN